MQAMRHDLPGKASDLQGRIDLMHTSALRSSETGFHEARPYLDQMLRIISGTAVNRSASRP